MLANDVYCDVHHQTKSGWLEERKGERYRSLVRRLEDEEEAMNAPAVCAVYYVEIMIMYCRHPDGSGSTEEDPKVLTLASQPKREREVCNPHLERKRESLPCSSSGSFDIIGDAALYSFS